MGIKNKKIIILATALLIIAVLVVAYFLVQRWRAAGVLPLAPRSVLESLALPSGGRAATPQELDAVNNGLAVPGNGGVGQQAKNETLQSLLAPAK